MAESADRFPLHDMTVAGATKSYMSPAHFLTMFVRIKPIVLGVGQGARQREYTNRSNSEELSRSLGATKVPLASPWFPGERAENAILAVWVLPQISADLPLQVAQGASRQNCDRILLLRRTPGPRVVGGN